MLPIAIECLTAALTLSGIAYLVLALWSARDFVHSFRNLPELPVPAPPVSVLKPLKGLDPRLYAAFVSHCTQSYPGPVELVFGIHTADDPAAAEVVRLRAAYPAMSIQLVVCPQQLGASGKVSNLIQMLPHAAHEHIVINDADIAVGPGYLTAILRLFAQPGTGMVTVPYLGRTGAAGREVTLWARLEALGISTDFLPGVLTARRLEGGIRFGLGSTLAVTRTALAAAGGLEPLVDYLADDYELGRRIAAAGFRVALAGECVETSVPAYTLNDYWLHQLRWARSTRDSRQLGYLGLGVTYCLPWALATVVASGAALWSITLLVLALLVRTAVALVIGVGILRDGQVLRDLWLLPLRDLFGLAVWAWSFAGDTVVWRNRVFRLVRGQLLLP